MPTLEAVLDRMGHVNREMRCITRYTSPGRNEEIAALRREFTAATGCLSARLGNDYRILSKPDLFFEFQERLADLRLVVANHQARWSLETITMEHDIYLSATEGVHGKIDSFLSWALESLSRD